MVHFSFLPKSNHEQSQCNLTEIYFIILFSFVTLFGFNLCKLSSHHEAKESIVYSYTKSFNAFAAKLSEDEANKLSAMNEVLSVFLNQYRKLHTTRSWDFIGLPLTAKRKLKLESDTIVALLDTGITPEFHSFHSFKDDGFGPPPVKWRGTCDKYVNFSGCNK